MPLSFNVGDLVRFKRMVSLGGRMGATLVEEEYQKAQGIIVKVHIRNSGREYVDLVLNTGEYMQDISVTRLEMLSESR